MIRLVLEFVLIGKSAAPVRLQEPSTMTVPLWPASMPAVIVIGFAAVPLAPTVKTEVL
jgi:hypothetical protein